MHCFPPRVNALHVRTAVAERLNGYALAAAQASLVADIPDAPDLAAAKLVFFTMGPAAARGRAT